jgi:Na+/H+ antiporter NhaB
MYSTMIVVLFGVVVLFLEQGIIVEYIVFIWEIMPNTLMSVMYIVNSFQSIIEQESTTAGYLQAYHRFIANMATL